MLGIEQFLRVRAVGRVIRGGFGNDGERGRLRERHVARGFTEERLGGSFHAVGGAAVGDFVQIQLQNLVFGECALKAPGQHDFLDFAGKRFFVRERGVFHELLGERAAAAARRAEIHHIAERGAENAAQRYALMGIEGAIFPHDGRPLEVLRNVRERDRRAFLFRIEFVERGRTRAVVDFSGHGSRAVDDFVGAGESAGQPKERPQCRRPADQAGGEEVSCEFRAQSVARPARERRRRRGRRTARGGRPPIAGGSPGAGRARALQGRNGHILGSPSDKFQMSNR